MKGAWRIFKRFCHDGWTLSRHYGLSYAFYSMLWWFCFYIPNRFSYRISRWAQLKKTAWLDRYLGRRYAHILKRFQENPPVPQPVLDSRIWIFWGQGDDAMPPLVKACYHQLCLHNSNVTLVTNENISQFIDLPAIIFQKVKDGRITYAHLSDIIRNTLLAQHGGFWLDATVWVPGRLPYEKFGEMSVFTASGTLHQETTSVCFWTSLLFNWSGWCLYAKEKHSLLFSFVSEMLQAIAVGEKSTPDYVIIDYLIYTACRLFPQVKQELGSCHEIHPCENRNALAKLMNEPFDMGKYKELCRTDFVFKLSFRSGWNTLTHNGQETFYGHLITGETRR